MSDHIDTLDDLNKHIPLKLKLTSAHEVIKKNLPFIARIAIAIYDQETRVLKTFIHSSDETTPLENYNALIDDAPSLKGILDQGLALPGSRVFGVDSCKRRLFQCFNGIAGFFNQVLQLALHLALDF